MFSAKITDLKRVLFFILFFTDTLYWQQSCLSFISLMMASEVNSWPWVWWTD